VFIKKGVVIQVMITQLLILTGCLVYPIGNDQKIIIIAPPKSGAHLAADLVSALTGRTYIFNQTCQNVDHTALTQDVLMRPSSFFHGTHIFHTKENKEALKTYKGIFVMRDPRDVAISFALLIKESSTWSKLLHFNVSKEKLISKLVRKFSIEAPGWSNSTIDALPTGNEFYRAYWGWKDEPNMLLVTYEDLIGRSGGGSGSKQLDAIAAIADHLEIPLDVKSLKKIARSFIDKKSIHNKIGAWKDHFTEKNIAEYKEVIGQLLIDMGYEKDFNW